MLRLWLWVLVLAFCWPVAGFALEVQGHRGARGLVPENTLPGFEAALELRVDVLELDLHLSRDGALVITHDPAILPEKCRPARAEALPPSRSLLVSSLDLAQLQRHYICDRNPEPTRFARQDATYGRQAGSAVQAFQTGRIAADIYAIPSLRELFDFVRFWGERGDAEQQAYARRVRFNIELKRVPAHPEWLGPQAASFEAKLVQLVRSGGLLERVTVQSFVHPALVEIRRLEPRLVTVALTGGQLPVGVEAVVRAAGASIWSPDYLWNTAFMTRAVQRAGFRVVPYTVNDPADLTAEQAKGVDGIITDFPNRLVCPGRRPLPPGCARFADF